MQLLAIMQIELTKLLDSYFKELINNNLLFG